jgi:hypothetical protein
MVLLILKLSKRKKRGNFKFLKNVITTLLPQNCGPSTKLESAH